MYPDPPGSLRPGTELQDFAVDARPHTAHEFVHVRLRNSILSGELAGGSRLVQTHLAKALGVSTTPVREALRDLAAEGLIRLDPYRGAVVRELDMDEVREIYELRKLLEPLSSQRAVTRISETQIQRAAELDARMEIEEDPGRWVELNREFHAIFADAAGSPRLQNILQPLRDSSAIYVALSIKVSPTRIQVGNSDHRELLDAVRRRDAEAAARIELSHLQSTLEVIEATAETFAAGHSAELDGSGG